MRFTVMGYIDPYWQKLNYWWPTPQHDVWASTFWPWHTCQQRWVFMGNLTLRVACRWSIKLWENVICKPSKTWDFWLTVIGICQGQTNIWLFRDGETTHVQGIHVQLECYPELIIAHQMSLQHRTSPKFPTPARKHDLWKTWNIITNQPSNLDVYMFKHNLSGTLSDVLVDKLSGIPGWNPIGDILWHFIGHSLWHSTLHNSPNSVATLRGSYGRC